MTSRHLLILAAAAALVPASASRFATGSAGPPPAAAARLLPGYGSIPLSFEPNVGQADARVKYLSQGRGYSLFLTEGEAVLTLRACRPGTREEVPQEPETAPPDRQGVVRLGLVGANPAPEVSGADERAGKSHYFIGDDPRRWRRDVPHYARVTYGAVYPGVDLVYHGRQGRLEYDFVVSPGADPGPIRVRFEGAEAMRLDGRGSLVLETSAGRLVQPPPLVYQEIDGERRRVSGSYVLHGGGHVGFAVGSYDSGRALVIDPVLDYSTYLGGSALETGTAIAVDASGNAYVTGDVCSADFPVESAYQQDHQLRTDAFVTKFAQSGSDVVYSTFLGGSGHDFGSGIAVDAEGHAWVAGRTSSRNFPTANPYQTDQPDVDAFVTKLSPSGSSLEYSTYLGGSARDRGRSIAVDAEGNAYVTGSTNSTDFPTENAYQGHQGGVDAFVTKISPSGTSLSYSTYLGGTGLDVGRGIAVDDAEHAVVTGETSSSDFPLVTPYQVDQPQNDAFLTRLSVSGSNLLYSTYLGGDRNDAGRDVAIDGAANAYVAGSTDSTDFPAQNAFQAYQGALDAFLAKVSFSGSTVVYSTYLGGGSDDVGYGVAVDVAGSAYVAGVTSSTDFPTLAPLPTQGGGGDAFVSKFAPSGAGFVYSTYLGGGGSDRAFGIAVDGSGNAYVVGDTESTDFPTQNPYQGDQPGRDVFVSKLAAPIPLGYFTVSPCRLVDTRLPSSPQAGPVLSCSRTPLPRTFPVVGNCSIPETASHVAGVVVVTEPSAAGELRFFPAGTIPPIATTIRYAPGLSLANNGIFLLGAGHLNVTCHQPSGTAHVVIDVAGYFEEMPEAP